MLLLLLEKGYDDFDEYQKQECKTKAVIKSKNGSNSKRKRR
jgi:hypothetical protein